MKVKELIQVLQNFSPEMVCVFTWESIFREFEKENIYMGNEKTLLFDADDNSYKEDFEFKLKLTDRRLDALEALEHTPFEWPTLTEKCFQCNVAVGWQNMVCHDISAVWICLSCYEDYNQGLIECIKNFKCEQKNQNL
jgi:hypothetical protein